MTDQSPIATANPLTDEQLLAIIDSFLGRSGIKPTRFGIEVMREGGLLASLRNGRSLSLTNANKVLAFIAEWDANNPGAQAAAATNSGENIAPFANAPTEGLTPPFAGATSTSTQTSEQPDSRDCSTAGEVRAA